MSDCVDMERLAAQVDCRGTVESVKPSSVHSVVYGIKSVLPARHSSTIHLPGLTSADVQQGSNTDYAVEFEFKRTVKLAGIWIPEQVECRPVSNLKFSLTLYNRLQIGLRNHVGLFQFSILGQSKLN